MSITDKAARALAKGETHSEKIAGRGAGALLLIGRDKSVSCYYRYTAPDRSRPWIELGTLGKEIGLAEARARCAELAALKKDHPNLKEWLESQHHKERAELVEQARAREINANNATFKDLLNDYLENMRAHGQVSEPIVKKAFKNEIIARHPLLVEMKACDIRPDHILKILKPVSARNALVYRNRIRSYVHAAFKFALHHEYDETRQSGKNYSLSGNPVTAIPVLRHAEKEGERALNDEELRQLYKHLHSVDNVSKQMADFIRFLIIIGGQRPMQVLRVPWSDYDFEQKTMLIRDLKGKRKDRAGRSHLIPLPDGAIEILEKLKPITGQFRWPFTTLGKVPFSVGSLKNVFKRFRESDYGKLNDKPIPHFIPRDLRRTTKQIMTRAGVRRDLRNLLQNHGQTGVDISHYANDPAAFLPEKRDAMQQYTNALKKVLEEKSDSNGA